MSEANRRRFQKRGEHAGQPINCIDGRCLFRCKRLMQLTCVRLSPFVFRSQSLMHSLYMFLRLFMLHCQLLHLLDHLVQSRGRLYLMSL